MTTLHLRDYEPYVQSVEAMAHQAATRAAMPVDPSSVEQVLDGQPGAELRRLVKPETRRAFGTFFTSSAMRQRIIEQLPDNLGNDAVVFDSSVGAGDLLLAYSVRLSVSETLIDTLRRWGQQLHGVDLEPELVRIARSRLLLAAVTRGAVCGSDPLPPLSELFPHIRVGNGLEVEEDYAAATDIVINPSFAPMCAPEDCAWTSGLVPAAAVFLWRAVTRTPAGTQIVAILPDVLRSGSRYERWRLLVEDLTSNGTVEVAGQFDPWTDVDVFILRCTVGGATGQPIRWWRTEELVANENVDSYFDVAVGPVVPHRDPEVGYEHAYLTARIISGQVEYDVAHKPQLRYSGTIFRPPFVVVRRTSRPGKGRIVGTVITGPGSVAVENHLIVLTPRDGSIAQCHAVISKLNDRRTIEWLDERIRCRHLTVQVVRDLPWWEKNSGNQKTTASKKNTRQI